MGGRKYWSRESGTEVCCSKVSSSSLEISPSPLVSASLTIRFACIKAGNLHTGSMLACLGYCLTALFSCATRNSISASNLPRSSQEQECSLLDPCEQPYTSSTSLVSSQTVTGLSQCLPMSVMCIISRTNVQEHAHLRAQGNLAQDWQVCQSLDAIHEKPKR